MPTTGSIGTRVLVSDLKGTPIAQNETKVGLTASHSITLASQQGQGFLPDFKVALRVIQDPDAASHTKLINASSEETSALTTGDAFGKLILKYFAASKDYLMPASNQLWAKLPESDRTQFAYNNITGRRLEQFFDEATKLLATTTLSSTEMAAGKKAINLMHADVFRNRNVEFDRANTLTYWSYGHDAAFVHVFEKMRDALPKTDPKREYLQKQIDFIYTHKYVPDGQVDENDVERSLKLMAIDAQSRHVVSLSKMSSSSTQASYVTLQIPMSSTKHPGRFAYRDGDNYYFEDTKELMKTWEVRLLREMYSSNIVFRPQQRGEVLRQNFRFDWDQNGIIQQKKVETGWWGHCDIKAVIETLLADMSKSGGVIEFNSGSLKTTQLSRADLLEALAAVLNFDNEYKEAFSTSTDEPQKKYMGIYNAAGGRFDDNPDDLVMTTPAGPYRFSMRLATISEKGAPDKVANLTRAFSGKLADDKLETFKNNDDIVESNGSDTNYIDVAARKFSGKTQGTTFDEKGNAVDLESAFEINPLATSGSRVLISSSLQSLVNRTTSRIYYDPTKKELFEVATRFTLEQGKYKAVEDTPVSLGVVSKFAIGHEMKENDDVPNKLKMMQDAIRSGDKIAADSDTGSQVWNGEVHTLRVQTEYRSQDGKWERVGLYSDATYGSNKVGTVINQLDAEGNIVDCCEVKSVVDFFWQNRPQVAPLVFEDGKWFANKAMSDRGILDLGEGRAASLAALQDVYDMIYLGFKGTDSKPIYTIAHGGKRLVYKDQSQWSEDVKRLTAASSGPQ